jgi:hypothetical protein
MSLWRRLAAAWPRLALCAIVLAAAGQTLLWVFLVPIYQAPDEPEHLDYALAINARRGLFLVQNTTFRDLPGAVHPYTFYLGRRARTAEVAFNPSAKMPPGYGTRAFYQALDRDAPSPDALPIDRPSQLAAVYPFGYYALLAGWIELVRSWKDGVVAVFFGARVFSVLLLCASLVLSYGTARLLNFRPGFCLLATACLGTFPLTSFVASYVQPDNLSFTLVSLCFYLALRARRGPCDGRLLGLLGLALGALLATKLHFWLCVAVPVLAMLATEIVSLPRERRRWLRALLLLLLPSAALGAAYWWTVRGTGNYFAPAAADADRLAYLIESFAKAVRDFYGGSTHKSFWGTFGWLDTPLTFGGPGTTAAVGLVLHGFAWAGLALTLWRLGRVAWGLARVARKGRPRFALRAALSNPVLNSYFVFTALMFYLYVRTDNRIGAQGRNWLPLLLPIFLVGLVYAPKALPRGRTRRVIAGVAAVGLLLYGLVGNYCARATIRERYYAPRSDAATSQATVRAGEKGDSAF